MPTDLTRRAHSAFDKEHSLSDDSESIGVCMAFAVPRVLSNTVFGIRRGSAPPRNGGEQPRTARATVVADVRLASIFRTMRQTLGVSVERVAAELRTSPAVIAALEDGLIYALPAWGETHRIVTTYAMRVGVDSRQILARLEGHLIYKVVPDGASSWHTGPAGAPAWPSTAPPQRTGRPSTALTVRRAPAGALQPMSAQKRAKLRKRRRRTARRLMLLSMLLGLIGGTLVAARLNPDALIDTARLLPQVIAAKAVPSAELLVFRAAPQRDGLRWVEVHDPRVRKGDKLPSANQ
jgi:Helix-turn-helix domain